MSEFQLDFDCAQKKLSGYSLWVEAVRTAVRPTRFVITTLPAWLNEPAFVPLVRLADSYVLQVSSGSISSGAGQSFFLNTYLARPWTQNAAYARLPFPLSFPPYP